MNRLIRTAQIASVGALLALGIAAKAEAGTCHPMFVAGQGVLDSCTGEHWDKDRYAPPEPTVIYVEVAPTINVSVSPVINVTSTSSSSANANVSAGASSTSVSVGPRRFPRVTVQP